MTYAADERVDAYIAALPDWQQSICRQVRDLVHAADPGVSETIKRTRQPYFVLQGNICALLAAKDHVNVFLYEKLDGSVTTCHDVPLKCSRTGPEPTEPATHTSVGESASTPWKTGVPPGADSVVLVQEVPL